MMLYCYLLVINALGFFFMLADKKKARRKKWRYSERWLLSIAAFGGSFGVLLGMLVFRHKTKKSNFSGGVPILLLIQLILLVLYIYTV